MLANEVNNRGQLTIFIIIGIFIVGAAVTFFVFKDRIFAKELSAEMQPVYTTFLSCLEEDVLEGADLLESQAGYIELPDFEAGSNYMPFGSQLNFLGNPIPYWYYVSGNNIQKEQVPSVNDMEKQLANYLDSKIRNCVFDSYYDNGFEINLGEPSAGVDIKGDLIAVNMNMDLSITKGESSASVSNHKIDVNSKLGTLYDSAREIYDKEQKEMLLENYAVDTLRLYAPVDGVELTCSPLTWSADEVFNNLQDAVEANTLALKVSGGDYSLKTLEDKYFVIDSDVNADVRFLTSKNWASSFEVAPSEGSVLIAEPVGNQPGLGVLGFCYVPYHFVYSVRYPVLVQIFSGDEIFQFPVAVVVEGNKPREALDSSAVGVVEDSQICENKNTLTKVSTYDSKLNPVESEISYECFGSICDIGKTDKGLLDAEFPQCVNGYIVSRTDGFKEARYLYSAIDEGSAEIILDKLYETDVQLKLDGNDYDGNAIASFISDDGSETIIYPGQKKIKLSEGQYEVKVYIYKNSSLTLGATTKKQCMEVPQSGLGGLFGITEEKCFDINIPEQIISEALVGGGSENYYILESELQNSNTLEINAGSLSSPKSLEELQNNYLLFESKGLDVVFK
ncbi:MAG: hypothetical protein KKF67_01960 [Nanoarchaeota archaeon]|nr:hypothetical protein [Nanoarchaeota archaeon]